MTDTLNGILPVLPTPFLKGGAVDLAVMPRLVRFAMDAGVGGIVFPGFASEVEHLTTPERRDLLAQVVKAGMEKLQLWPGPVRGRSTKWWRMVPLRMNWASTG